MTISACELEAVRGGFSEGSKSAAIGASVFGTMGFLIGGAKRYGVVGRLAVGALTGAIGAGLAYTAYANNAGTPASQAK